MAAVGHRVREQRVRRLPVPSRVAVVLTVLEGVEASIGKGCLHHGVVVLSHTPIRLDFHGASKLAVLPQTLKAPNAGCPKEFIRFILSSEPANAPLNLDLAPSQSPCAQRSATNSFITRYWSMPCDADSPRSTIYIPVLLSEYP